MIKKTVGGDRLLSGDKISQYIEGYSRSNHDLSFVWKSSMASGVLTPCWTELGLNGDDFDVNIQASINTLPTVGPLFGSYKFQVDVFSIPIRLYQAQLHNNKLGIGLNMKNIKLPQFRLNASNPKEIKNIDNEQTNPSSLIAHLGVRGIGTFDDSEEAVRYREFNAVPLLGYFDIFKNYYSNKQEEDAYIIHNPLQEEQVEFEQVTYFEDTTSPPTYMEMMEGTEPNNNSMALDDDSTFMMDMTTNTARDIDGTEINIWYKKTNESTWTKGDLSTLFRDKYYNIQNSVITWSNPRFQGLSGGAHWTINQVYENNTNAGSNEEEIEPRMFTFPLKNIDDMREEILSRIKDETTFIIDKDTIIPYGQMFKWKLGETSGNYKFSVKSPLEGLLCKTYDSDLFNNWLDKESIDGENGINELTKIIVDEDGGFTVDEFLISQKVYNMLNKINLSGGTYHDWQEVVYGQKIYRLSEIPVYEGSLIKKIAFQEVVSQSGNNEQPLGTLAGRGIFTDKHIGGNVKISVNEPSYLMAIASITPKIDYSQGNHWNMSIKTLDDLHKPDLDQIGFQDLITDQMYYAETRINADGTVTTKSAGKQPAWTNYTTNVNVVRGNFAIETDSMYMILNRRYEPKFGIGNSNAIEIKDLSTYIDPLKYNYIFNYTRRDAQNFWVNIGFNIQARRVMSANQMPNL